MSKSLLDSYVKDTITLAKTMVIKSQESADGINRMVASKNVKYVADPDASESWKYYLNLAGRYHESDPLIEVVSLDNGVKGLFSAAWLKDNPATRDAYQYGSRYYVSLVSQYPEMESFILGCLNPVHTATSVAALPGTILSYPPSLVEEQEVSLISELQDWVDSFNFRWHVKAFSISDNLYYAAQHGILYLNLVPRLFNLRLKRCKTPEAHSFHIGMHLASHGGLDVYMPYMTLKQKLWLYRNIAYIERNAGKASVFKTLIDKLLTDRMIPLEEFSLRYLAEIVDDGTDLTGTNTKHIRRKALNVLHNAIEEPYLSVERLLTKELPTTIGNEMYVATSAASIYSTMNSSRSSVVQTKVLDSSMMDYSNETPDTLVDVLLRNWVMMANKGLYTATVQWQDPSSSKFIKVSALDAFAYMWYIQLSMVADSICTAHGWTYSDIWKFFPRYINERQRKVELPTRRDLYDLIEGDARLTTYADNLIRRQPKISSVLNVTDFYSLSKNIYEEHIRQRFEIAAEEDMYRRAYVEAVTTWLYEDEYIDWSFAVPPVSQWLAERGLPAYSGDIKLSGDLVTNIFIAATGMDGTDFNTLKGIQNAMVSIMGGLSSYSVQFLKSINSTDVIPLNYPVVRAGDVRGFSHDSKELPISPGYVHLEGVAKSILTEEISVETPVLSSKVYIKSMPLDVSMSKELRHDTIGLIDCYLSTIQTSASYPGYSSAISSKQSFINYEQFDSLTVAQKIAVFNGGVIPVTPAPTSPTASQTTGLAASFTGTVKVINPSTGKTVATYDIPPDTLEDVQTDMLAHPTYTIVATPAVVAKFKVINTDSSTTTTAVISTSATFNASSLQVLSGTDSSVVSGASVSNTSAVAGVYEWTVSIPPMPPNPPFVPRASVTWTE